ncbi:MAG: ATP-binding protein [Bacteroidota bacterium]
MSRSRHLQAVLRSVFRQRSRRRRIRLSESGDSKFHRVARANGASGTGLGLAISRGIVEAHGGGIAAVPRDGGGLQVQFSLPLAGEGGRDR